MKNWLDRENDYWASREFDFPDDELTGQPPGDDDDDDDDENDQS